MQVSYLNGQHLFLHENAVVDSGKNNHEFKGGSNTDITASELEVEVEKLSNILLMTLNIIYRDRSSRCYQQSCHCGNELNLPSTADCFNANRSLVQWNLAAGKYLDCFTFDLLFKSTSLSSTPFNLRLSKFIFKIMINERKARRIKDLGGILSLIDSNSNTVLSNFAPLKHDQLAENHKAKDLLKISLKVHLGIVDELVTQLRSTLISPFWRSLESSSFKLIDQSSSHKPNNEIATVGKYSSNFGFLETKHVSCPRFDSLSSRYSTVPVDISISKGWLHFLQMHGMTYLCFSAGNVREVIYVAVRQRPEANAGKAIDYMYLVYFIDSKSSYFWKHSLKATNLIAKMKVTSSIVVKSNRKKTMETEFVLYASREPPNAPQKSFSVDTKSMKFSRKVTETFRSRNMKNNKPGYKVTRGKSDGLHDINEPNLRNDAVGELLPNLELAAIIVEECLHDSSDNLMVGGWGLKFLEKASKGDTLLKPLIPQYRCEKFPYNRDGSAHSMTVIIPAGFHGSPVSQIGGPTSLIDRWRSGGVCDCGGWDVGCPLRVLNYISISSNASTKETETDNPSVKIFMEGTKKGGHPALSMVNMTGGLYSICFNRSLSALQSFAVAVASIHASIPDLATKS